MPIKVLKKEDGLWLQFQTEDRGLEALVNVRKITNGSGSIVETAVIKTCEECAARTKESTPLCPKCNSSYVVQIASPWGCDNCGYKW